jgi:hypothetical protein
MCLLNADRISSPRENSILYQGATDGLVVRAAHAQQDLGLKASESFCLPATASFPESVVRFEEICTLQRSQSRRDGTTYSPARQCRVGLGL